MGSKKDFTWQQEKPKNVGQVVYDILQKDQHDTTVGEILDEYQYQYLEEIIDCIQKNRHKFDSPFYIVVLTKKEPWALNVMRNWFIARQTKPSAKIMREDYPNFMQTVYKWNDKDEKIDILWSLPIAQDAQVVLKNKQLYDAQLVKWVMDFQEGKLN